MTRREWQIFFLGWTLAFLVMLLCILSVGVPKCA